MFRNLMQKSVLLVLIFILFPAITHCSREQKEAPPDSVVAKRGKFNLGLIPEQDLFSQIERYKPIAKYLSKETGLNIELKILSRYGNIIDNFQTNELDGAFFGSFTGAMAIIKIGVEPLARPVWFDGTSTYYGMIFVRKDSGIHTAADMKGKRFAFVDKATTAGWLLPLHYFEDIGISDFNTWFSETYFTGTHEDAIYDVLDGKADIGAAKNTVFYRLADQDKKILDELKILTTSPEVPANTLCVRHDLDNSLKIKLQNTLLQMDQDKEGIRILHAFGAQKFIETRAENYSPVFQYAEEIRLDLEKYKYDNR